MPEIIYNHLILKMFNLLKMQVKLSDAFLEWREASESHLSLIPSEVWAL